jgi:YHS domain-containing protein
LSPYRTRTRILKLSLLLAAMMATALAAAPARIVKADVKHVCMIHDRAYSQAQYPVALSGHTYYVYCNDCKAKLNQNAALRTAVDPVTGKRVDKATAVVGVKPTGEVLYFESDATLAKYAAGK